MTTTRAISTVIDASVCLLLVSASALTLVAVPTDGGAGDPSEADETAAVLATSTARVSYEVGDENQTAHDTLAGLLATAAAAVASGPNDSGVTAIERFENAVTERVGRTLQRSDGGAQVVARAESPPDAASEPRVIAGERPPPDADVHAASFSVPEETGGVDRVQLTVRTWSG